MNGASRRTATGRADLVRTLGALPREQQTHAVNVLGFIPRKEPDPEIAMAFVDADDEFDEAQDVAEGKTISQESPKPQRPNFDLPLLRFDRMEFTDDADAGKPSTTALEEVTHEDLRSPGRSLFATPRPQPLTPWSRLWPMLRDALQSSLPSRDLDVDAYVRKISRGETILEIPRKTRRVWAGRISVWIDRSQRLGPFWDDQMEVWQGLRKLCNKNGIKRRLLDGRMQKRSMRRRDDLLDGFSHVVDCPILVLGDLGLYGSDEDRAAWEQTRKRLDARGSHVTALVPGAASRFLPFMKHSWNAMAWERGRIQGKPLEGWTERRDRLLKMVSPVALLQPGLLRAIRRILPAALADASTEADVWNHADVEVADATGWLLERAALLQWRNVFATDASLVPYLEKLRNTIRVWHENLPREILRGDTLVWHALLPGVMPPGDLQDAMEFAKRLEGTALAGGGETKVAEALRSFQKKLLAAMPPAIYEKVPALATVWVASFDEGEVPPGVDALGIRGKLEAPGETQHWAVRQVGRRLEFSLNERGPAWPSHVEGPGSPVAWFVARRPWVTIVRGQTEEQHRLEPGLSLLFEPDEPLTIRTDRCSITIAPWHREPWVEAAGRDRFGLWADENIRGVVQRFRWIPPGRFLMGSPKNEAGRDDNEGPQHEVTWTQGRWLGDTPVTQALWKAVQGTNPSHFQRYRRFTDDRPVEMVSWNDCVAFAKKIGTRLPTEAEWEYACRGGTTTATWVGDLVILGDNNAPVLDPIAWYGGNSGMDFDLEEKGYDATKWKDKQHEFAKGGTRGVRRKERNPFGLYDMLGNVYEWCSDVDHTYTNAATKDPEPVSSTQQKHCRHVLRGGAWESVAGHFRAADRFPRDPGYRRDFVGFRLARGANADDVQRGEK